MAEKLDPQQVKAPTGGEGGREGAVEVSLSVFLRRVLVSFVFPFLLLTTLLPAYAQEALWKDLSAKAWTLYQQGRYAEGVKVAQEALKVAKESFGPDHPNLATSLNILAELYRAQGQYAAAEPLYKRSLAIREKALGPDHPDVATVLENISELYKETGRMDEAKRFEERANAIRSRNK